MMRNPLTGLATSMLLTTMSGCFPKYAALGPMAPEDLWTPLSVQHIEVNGIDVAYVDSAPESAETPLILIHGLSSYVGFWEYQVPAFAEDRRVLALDLPGYGASARPDAPYTPPWYADLVADWMRSVGVPHADVMGHSMGGQIALTLALEYPERIDRLVLAAPSGFETFEPGAAKVIKDYWTEDRALHTTEQESRMAFTTAVFNKTDDGVERLLKERVRLGQHPAFEGTSVAVSRSIRGMIDHPVFERLGEIEHETLVVYGTEDRMIPNPFFTGGRTRTIAECGVGALTNAQLVMLPGAGHTVHHDAPKSFNDAVRSFLGGAQ